MKRRSAARIGVNSRDPDHRGDVVDNRLLITDPTQGLLIWNDLSNVLGYLRVTSVRDRARGARHRSTRTSRSKPGHGPGASGRLPGSLRPRPRDRVDLHNFWHARHLSNLPRPYTNLIREVVSESVEYRELDQSPPTNRGGPRNSDRLLRWDPDHREGVWNVPKETKLAPG